MFGALNALEPVGDDSLSVFLGAGDGPQAEDALARLLSCRAAPIAQRILRRKARLSGEDAEDLVSRVLVRLLCRLRAIKAGGLRGGIGSFDGYVATTTYRTYSDEVRRSYPGRHRLKAKLRHLLSHDPRLALWEDLSGGWLCGLASWSRPALARPPHALTPADEERVRLAVESYPRCCPEALCQVLEAVGRPLAIDPLVTLVASSWESRPPSPTSPATDLPSRPEPGSPVAQVHDRICLRQLWTELSELPRGQRQALLLHLRDAHGRSLMSLLPLTGTATIHEIAGALEMAPQELARLWNGLPLDDHAIAQRLGLTRQQVINLRCAARRRLARRLRA